MKKSKYVLLTLIYSLWLVFATNIEKPAITPISPVPTDEFAPCADNLQWVYKVSDGKLYRRLYNSTKDIWVGGWELFC